MTSLPAQSLFHHIEKADVLTVRQLLQSDTINPEERDVNGQTFLIVAAQHGNVRIVKEILDHEQTDVNAVDNDNWSALISAAKGGHAECMRILLDVGALINHKDIGGWTALMWACYKGRVDCVKMLLDRGANPNAKGEHHMSCLTWAAGRGHTEVVRSLLKGGAKVNTADKYGTTPLIWACRKGFKEIVEMLLDAEATVDNTGMYSYTALIAAAKNGYVDVVTLLLNREPNINITDKDGYTALTWAAKDGNFQIVRMLLQKEAYVNVPDRFGDTILIHAVKGGHAEVVSSLLKKYADLDVIGVDGKTALYWAVEKGNNDVLRKLLEQNANIEISNMDGDTPLMKAVRLRNPDAVKMMLSKGAKVSTSDKRGDTPLHVAVRGRSKRITELLLRHPKDSRLLYRPNKAGETPYQIDGRHEKSVLTQVFGTRNINAMDNMQGYELYSSTIADVLSEPALNTPITVGLFAKWGSGKSVLIDQLVKEMKTFTEQQEQPQCVFSWCQGVLSLCLALLLGIIVYLAVNRWWIALTVFGGVLLFQYLLLGLVELSVRFHSEWDWSYNLSVYLGKQERGLRLACQVLFCNEKKISTSDTTTVLFLFTDNARLASVVGEKSITGMIATLCQALENEYGAIVTRIYKVFKPKKGSGKYKTLCCLPYFLIIVFVLLLVTVALVLVAELGFSRFKYKDERLLVDVVVTTVATLLLLVIIGNMKTWIRTIYCLLVPPKRRVNNIGKRIDSLKMEGFMQSLKKEVELMGQMTNCMDGFLGTRTRLVVIVDGLDSCEQEKLLQVLDTLHILFGDAGSPFITLLAVDPHFVIKGIEANIAMKNAFHESAVNGYDYLSNIIQLPIFLQGQLVFKRVTNLGASLTDIHASTPQFSDRDRKHAITREDSVVTAVSSQSISDLKKRNFTRKNTLYSSSGDLTHNLGKNTYFSDINPRNLRRLMNIVAVTARLLRAVAVDFSWSKLMSWIFLTEQWPYRISWILMELEEAEDIDRTMPIRTVYDRVKDKIPSTQERLPEMDRNPRKLELFLRDSKPMLTSGDVQGFMLGTVNVDPYLRKVIRDHMEAQEAVQSELNYGTVGNLLLGDPWKSNSLRAGRPSSVAGRMSLSPHLNLISPLTLQQLVAQGVNPVAARSTTASDFSGPTHSDESAKRHKLQKQFRVKLADGLPKERLSSMTVDQVCNVLRRLEGLSTQQLPTYQARLQDNNISGAVLSNCDLSELRGVLQMSFGDWELFKCLVLLLRERESFAEESSSNESLTQPATESVSRERSIQAPPVSQEFRPMLEDPPSSFTSHPPSSEVLMPEPQPRMKRVDTMAYEVEMAQGILQQFIQMSGVEEQDPEEENGIAKDVVVDMNHADSHKSSLSSERDVAKEGNDPMTESKHSSSSFFMSPDQDSGSDSDMEMKVLQRRGSKISNRSQQNTEAESSLSVNIIQQKAGQEQSFSHSQERLRTMSRGEDTQGPSAFRNLTPGSSRPPSPPSTRGTVL